MQANKISLRYAKAIVDALNDANLTKTVVEELKSFASVISSSKELELALTSQLFSDEARENIISDLAAKLKVGKDTLKILRVISVAKRLKFLASIAEAVHNLQLETAGVVPLKVQAASEMNADEKKSLEKKFAKILEKEVEASYEVEPSLLGGVKVTAAGRTYDGSVAGWLNTFEEQLVGGNI